MFNEILINGKSIKTSGNNVIISNEKVIIDGMVKAIEHNIGHNVKVVINGDVNQIKCSGSVEVHGNTGEVNCGGSCHVNGNVTGDIDAGGSVNCRNVTGSIDAGGSVSRYTN